MAGARGWRMNFAGFSGFLVRSSATRQAHVSVGPAHIQVARLASLHDNSACSASTRNGLRQLALATTAALMLRPNEVDCIGGDDDKSEVCVLLRSSNEMVIAPADHCMHIPVVSWT
jgi:hypothetical protein